MKKSLSFAFAVAVAFNALGNAAFAQVERLNWFESLDNMQKLKSYTMAQVLSADVTGQIEEGQTGSGNFTLNINTSLVNRENYKMDTKNSITGKLHIKVEGKDKPFDALDANFRISVVSIADQEVYVRLEKADFEASGIREADAQGYQDAKTQLGSMLEPILWQWIRIPNQDLVGEVKQELPTELGNLDAETLKADLKKNGFQETFQKLIESELNSQMDQGEMPEADAAKAKALMERFFKTEFFRLKSESKPNQEESTSFTLNKNQIFNFVRNASKELGENISSADLAALRDALRKFSLSGSFHQNNQFGVFDRLKVKLALKNLKQVSNVQLDYATKIGNINAVDAIKAPAKTVTLEELGLSLPSASVQEPMSDSGEGVWEPVTPDMMIPLEANP